MWPHKATPTMHVYTCMCLRYTLHMHIPKVPVYMCVGTCMLHVSSCIFLMYRICMCVGMCMLHFSTGEVHKLYVYVQYLCMYAIIFTSLSCSLSTSHSSTWATATSTWGVGPPSTLPSAVCCWWSWGRARNALRGSLPPPLVSELRWLLSCSAVISVACVCV